MYELSCVYMAYSLVLQALVEVDGSGLGTGLSYPLLQVFFQAANTHRATQREENVVFKCAAVG